MGDRQLNFSQGCGRWLSGRSIRWHGELSGNECWQCLQALQLALLAPGYL